MNKMKTGEKYLVLQIGELKIPFFPNERKEGKKYYQTIIKIWVNEKKKENSNEEI